MLKELLVFLGDKEDSDWNDSEVEDPIEEMVSFAETDWLLI